jgi:flagellar basal-body rod protein FlgG
MAQSQNLDVIANNLANANTTGFKRDTPTFKEYLTAVERPPSPDIDIPRTAFKDSDFYHFDGREHAMVNVDHVHTDHAQGTLKMTNGPFDLAIDGPGFFAVKTPAGTMYTRAGDFKVGGDGVLVTNDGYPVLGLTGDAATLRSPASVNPFSTPQGAAAAGAPGAPVPQPPIITVNLKDALTAGTKVMVTPDGEVFAGDQQVALLAVAEFADPRLLQKATSSLYTNPDPANVARVAADSRVKQGFLETSNVNPVSELVELLKANRMFESNMRAIKAYSDMAGKEANEVGKL